MRNGWCYLPVAYGRISPTKFYRGLARIKGTSSFPASGIKACQSTFFQGFLLHPFKLWIWKGKLKTPILDEHQKNVHKLAETSRTFFTQFFFLERFLQLFFTVPLQRNHGSPFCIKHHQALALWLKRFTSLSKCSPVPVSGLILQGAKW